MPSPIVIEKLEKLQTELETVSFAIKHIEDASKVAKTAADILKEIPELLSELKSVEEKHRKDLQKDLKEKIDAIEKQLQLLLIELKDKTNQLSQIIEETKKLEKAINEYFLELRKINFPERLDKIDNQISSINIGVGNLQTTIQRLHEKIEKGFEEIIQILRSGFSSINDSLKHSQEKVISDLASHTNSKTDEIIKNLTEQNQRLKKEVKTNRIIQIVGLTIILIILIYIAVTKHK
jgi:DNA repair exonuclease SbcCD ATPase subunit